EAARQALISGRAQAALDEADRLAAAARAAPESRAAWSAAIEAAKRAEDLLAQGGTPTLRHRAAETRADLERAAKLVADLDRARLRLAQLRAGDPDRAGFDAAYRRAFADFGVDVLALPPEEAAR